MKTPVDFYVAVRAAVETAAPEVYSEPGPGGCHYCGNDSNFVRTIVDATLRLLATPGCELIGYTGTGPACACGGTFYSYATPWGAAFNGNNVQATCLRYGCTAAHSPFRVEPENHASPDVVRGCHEASRDGRTFYRIRFGRKWLARGLVCKPNGARLIDSETQAGLYDGPVRSGPDDPHGPALTTGLARNLLDYPDKVFCVPADGGPGFWSY